MTDYGQSIPPRWYRSTVAQQVTKMNFAHQLHRALMQVGMIPIRAWNPFDLELPANAEYAPGTSGRSNLIWYYDFPSSETFAIDGVLYRPVFAMVVMTLDNSAATTSSEACSNFWVEYGVRRADRTVRDDYMSMRRTWVSPVTATNFGHGEFNDGIGVASPSSVYENVGNGLVFSFQTWKVHAASVSTTRTQLLGFRNMHVILCKGGLLIQVGSGVGKADSADFLSVLIAFGGARVPGRARIPANDVNLNKINPTFPLALRHAATNPVNWFVGTLAYDDITMSTARISSFAIGCQHDLAVAVSTVMAGRVGAVHLQIFNLENIERPFFPSSRGDTVNSPREHPSGAAHILQPLVYVQDYQQNTTLYFQVQDFNIRPQIAPTWFDVWMTPKVRFTDRTAPAGEYVDPVTNLNWWLFRAEGANTMMAVEVEGITKFSTLGFFDTFTLNDTDYFNLNGGFTWTVGNPQQAVAAQSIQSGSVIQAWTTTPATDEATVIIEPNSSVSLTFTAEPYVVSSDTSFSLQFELRWFSVSAQTNGTSNPMHIEYSSDNGTTWVTLQSIFNNGVSTGNPFHAYTLTSEFSVWPGSLDARIRFRLRAVNTGATGGNRTAMIRGIRIRQYVRAP